MKLLPPLCALTLVACSGLPERRPLPADLVDSATIPGIPDARGWADAPPAYTPHLFELTSEELAERFPAVHGVPHNYLAISGGGPRGAFGAGLLCGWTERGDRPEFQYVTGVSTGALIAPFAFLGPEHDHVLEEIYTQFSTEDLVKERGIFDIAFGDAALDTQPLVDQIERLVTPEVVAALARESARGRSLQIVTTNLDASRPMMWNIGRIAASGDPGATQLIRDVILASASIPVAFPPVLFEVEADGERYDELHVDGGATSVVFLYPISFDWEALLQTLKVPGRPNLYVIRNGYLTERYDPVKRNVLAIAGNTIDTLMGAAVLGDLYRIYLEAERDGLRFHLAAIPESFIHPEKEPFDRDFMRALFDLGRRLGVDGYTWSRFPPGYEAPSISPGR